MSANVVAHLEVKAIRPEIGMLLLVWYHDAQETRFLEVQVWVRIPNFRSEAQKVMATPEMQKKSGSWLILTGSMLRAPCCQKKIDESS